MYCVHTQPGNAYDIGDHLYHLTVHKHLNHDPLIQFREALRWVVQVRLCYHRPALSRTSRLWVACLVLAAAVLVSAFPHGGFPFGIGSP